MHRVNVSFILCFYLMSYPVMATTMEDTQASGTDLEEINTEDEMATDTSQCSEKE